jgi:phage replication O-like protein O
MSAAVHQIAAYTPRSPQLENGYLRIANELQEAISAADVSKRELKVLNVIIRMTYGFRKKEDDIAASQIGQACRMGSSHVTEALNSLAKKNIITKRRGRIGCVVGIQKDYALWPMDDMPVEYSKPKKAWARKELASAPPKLEVVAVTIPAEVPTEVLPKEESSPPISGVSSPPISGDSKDSSSFKDILPKKTPSAPKAEPAGFAEFYQAYPKKKGRKEALAAFAKLNPDADLLAQIMAGVAMAKKDPQWRRGVIPHPATFLNNERWTDEVIIAFSDAELAVLNAYNDALADVCGYMDPAIFSDERAALITDFLTLSDKPEFWLSYFPWVAKNADLPPNAGFDYLIGRDGFSKVKGGQFTKRK